MITNLLLSRLATAFPLPPTRSLSSTTPSPHPPTPPPLPHPHHHPPTPLENTPQMDPSRHPTEVGSQAIDLHPPATPSKQPSSTSTSLSFGLPSPTSLPRLVEHTHSGSDLVGMSLGSASFVDGDARRQEAVDPMDECELVDSATSEDSSSSPPPNEDYAMAMFPLDVEMLSTSSSSPGDLPNSSGALSHDDSR